jgi:hypothetical protein
MKAGYATLFSLAVAYSAYQGAGSLQPGARRQESITSFGSTGSKDSARTRHLPPGAEPFPSIAGGICPLILTGSGNGPCGDCKGICPASELSELIENAVPRSQRGNIKFVIASLPDPVHTHMALLLDRGIESIQQAAQVSGYLFSRAWMPWDIATHAESTDFTVRMAQEKLRDRKESLPGLMIFRMFGGDPASPQRYLFVFVVGETSTGGLHVEQFENALKIRQRILADAKRDLPEANILRISGPAFSGSLASLETILNAQRHDQFSTILIRSGTISSCRAASDFRESISMHWPSAGKPNFATFQFSDAYEEFYLKFFFRNRIGAHSHVAILSEDETAFGNQEVGRRPKAQSAEKADPCEIKLPPSLQDGNFVRLYFPREIAQLRDAYQRNVKEQSGTDGKKDPQSVLPLSLSVTGNDDDSVASFAPLQMPLSQESILQSIVATLRYEHVRVVIIRGADPLDVIFLCRYLRQNYPQARLVTTGADLLMIHDFYDPRFHGILAVTPYPLLAGAHFPEQKDGDGDRNPDIHRLFPDSSSAGSFNAFLSLLAKSPETESENLPSASYAEFGLPSFLQPEDAPGEARPWRAHLWLTAVGQEGYWPVSLLEDVPESVLREKDKPEPSIPAVEGAPVAPPEPYSVHFSIGWTLLWLSSFGLTVVLAFFLLFPPASSRFEILARFRVFLDAPNRFKSRNCLLFTLSLFLLASQTVFLFPAIVWLGRFGLLGEGPSEIVHGLERVAVSYLISAGCLGVACYLGFMKRGSAVLARTGAWACGAAMVVTALFTAFNWSRKLGTGLGAFVYRYINVSSGVSPSLPVLFLLAAWIWWCWQSLTGVVSTQDKRVFLPDKKDFDPPPVPEAYSWMRLTALANRETWPWKSLGAVPYGWWITVPAGLGFLGILLLIHPWEIAEAFEDPTYKWLYWILLYSCLLLVCYLLAQIVLLWLEFRELLDAIEGLAFRRGFSDLKSLTWKPLWKLAGNGMQEFSRAIREEIAALRHIQNSKLQDGGLAKAIKDATKRINDVATHYELGEAQKVAQLFDILQKQFAKVASEALIYANEQWKTEAFTPPAAKADTSSGEAAATEPPSDDITLRAIEHFLCLFYLNVILVPLRRLQTLILAMAGVFVFVLISYGSYPFESRESFHALLICVFFVISLVVGIVYGQMYANPLLSRITNTKPGEVGLDFWVRLGTFVFVPLLSLLSVQFPEVNNFLFSWLQPALQSIK